MHKLDKQKEKYSVELGETLQQAYGKHNNAQLAWESQQDVAAWLGESTQPASIREFLHRAEKKTHSAPKHSKDTPQR